MIDLVTTAPISFSGKNCANSLPELAQPLAVKIGVLKNAFPRVVEKSNSLMNEPRELAPQDAIALVIHP